MANYLSSDLTRARNAFSAYIFRVRLYVIIYKESQSETMLFVTVCVVSRYMRKMSVLSGLLHLLDSKTTPMYCNSTLKQRIGVIGAFYSILRWVYS